MVFLCRFSKLVCVVRHVNSWLTGSCFLIMQAVESLAMGCHDCNSRRRNIMHLDWRLRLASPLHTQEGSTIRAWQASRRSRCWRQRRPAGNHKLRKWQHVVTVRPRPVCRHVRRRAHILGRTLRPRNGKGEASEDEEEVEPNCKDMMTRSRLFVPLTHASFPILDLWGPHFNDLEVLNRSRWSFFFFLNSPHVPIFRCLVLSGGNFPLLDSLFRRLTYPPLFTLSTFFSILAFWRCEDRRCVLYHLLFSGFS